MPKKPKEELKAENQFHWAAQFMHDGKWITLYGAPYESYDDALEVLEAAALRNESIKLRLLPIAKK